MTKDNFRALCEQVLIPRLGGLLHGQFVDMLETLELQSRELIRLDERLGRVEKCLTDLIEYGKEARE